MKINLFCNIVYTYIYIVIQLVVTRNLQRMRTLKFNDIVKDIKNNKIYIVLSVDRFTKGFAEVSLFKNGKAWGTSYTKPIDQLEIQS